MFIGLAAQGESTAVQQRTGCTISPGDDSEVGGRDEGERGQRYSFEMEETGRREERERETTTPNERGRGRKENNNNPTFQLLPVASWADRQTQQLFQEFTS